MDNVLAIRRNSERIDFGAHYIILPAQLSNNQADLTIEQFTASLLVTTSLERLCVNFHGFESTPENNRLFERFCRCIANLRSHNPNHPLRTLQIYFAKKDDRNAVDQLLLAAKQNGIHELCVSQMNLPVQSLVEFFRGNTQIKSMILRRLSISDDESTMSVVSPQNGLQDASIITTLDNLILDDVCFKYSTAVTKFLNFVAHATYLALGLGKITVASGGSKEEKKIARMRIVSEIIKPSVLVLLLHSGCRIENMNVIAARATIMHIELDGSEPPKKFSSDAVQQKLQEIATRNKMALGAFFVNPTGYPSNDLLTLMIKFDGNPTLRYLLVQGFAAVPSFFKINTSTDSDTVEPS